jgi:hypothetical protein
LLAGDKSVGLSPFLNIKSRPPNRSTLPAANRDILGGMIIGAHFLLYSNDADADRAFFRDVLGFRFVDVGGGWLIFAMSPAEAAIHPLEGESSQNHAGRRLLDAVLYLMCDDLKAMIADLRKKKVECTEIEEARWGIKTTILLPSGGHIGLYQPRHATALNLKSKPSRTSKPSKSKSSPKKKRLLKKR